MKLMLKKRVGVKFDEGKTLHEDTFAGRHFCDIFTQ